MAVPPYRTLTTGTLSCRGEKLILDPVGGLPERERGGERETEMDRGGGGVERAGRERERREGLRWREKGDCMRVCVWDRERETDRDRQTDRQTDRDRGRQRDRDRQRQRQRDRREGGGEREEDLRERERERERETETETERQRQRERVVISPPLPERPPPLPRPPPPATPLPSQNKTKPNKTNNNKTGLLPISSTRTRKLLRQSSTRHRSRDVPVWPPDFREAGKNNNAP